MTETTTQYVLQLFPEIADVNGDAQNALVLARRLQWSGFDAQVSSLAEGAQAPDFKPIAIVLGSGVDSTVSRTRDALDLIRGALDGWLAAGVPLLAVGTGLELLGRTISLESGVVQGLGLVAGETAVLPARATGEISVKTAWGELVGYENHARGFVRDSGVDSLGRVLRGIGNGDLNDGVHVGSIFGTHVHGPVLARNPWLADRILGHTDSPPPAIRRVDAVAAAVNASRLPK